MNQLKLRFLFRIFVSVFLIINSTTALEGQIYVKGTIDGTDFTNYSTLANAFNAVNNGVHKGDITVEIRENVSDNTSAILNENGFGAANYTSLVLYPTVTCALIGNIDGALISLNGADNVIIDGRINRTGSLPSLTISNTYEGANSVTVQFLLSAQSNTIQYCNILGLGNSNNSGTIFFSTAIVGTGNNNNIISYNNLTGRTSNVIYSFGTPGNENKNNTISYNNFYNHFKADINSYGIFLDGNTTNFNITKNSFYETTSIIPTSFCNYQHIRIYPTSGNIGNSFNVKDNYIGGQSANCGGAKMQLGTISQNIQYHGIVIFADAGTASTVQGNTIRNINLSSANTNPFNGIYIASGIVNIKENNIGSDAGVGMILVTTSVNSSTYAINISTSSDAIVTNNIVGALSCSTNSSTVGNSFYGIYKPNTSGALTLLNNKIGSLTSTNNINATSTSTSGIQSVYDIYTQGVGITNISNNLIGNLTNSSTLNSNLNNVIGIYYNSSNLETNLISKNYICNLKYAGTNALNSLIVGINIAGNSALNCSNNIINIGNNTTSALSIRGISNENNNSINFYHNTIYISGSTTGTNASTFGFYKTGTSGNVNIFNNIFMNARSGGTTGYHYAIGLENMTNTNLNYNSYYVSGTIGAMLGRLSTVNYNSIANWRSATAQDINSVNVLPSFSNQGGIIPESYKLKTNILGTNVMVNDDYAQSNIRNTVNPTIGAWEYRKNYWVGTTNTNWATTTNWTEQYVPASGEDIEFATVDNCGVAAINELVPNTDKIIGKLKNYSTKAFVIPSVSGGRSVIVNDSVKTSGNAGLIWIKASSSFPNGSLIFTKPSINQNVRATIEMYSKAYKGPPTTSVLLGTTMSYRWQHFGIPIKQIQANPTFAGSYVRQYDESRDIVYGKWIDLTNYSILYPFKGYEITHDYPHTLWFQGTLIACDTTIVLPLSNVSYGAGNHILSNPFTAAIDIRKIIFGPNTEATIYLFNTGTFAQWEAYDGTFGEEEGQYLAIPQNTASVIAQEIPSMQGFLVKVSGNPGSITIPYNAVISSAVKNTAMQRITQNDPSLSYLKINVKGNSNFEDNMWIFEKEGTTRDFDNGWDGYKKKVSEKHPQLFSWEESGKYQVNTINDINNSYLGFKAGQDTAYALTFVKSNLDKYSHLYIEDLKNNTTIKLDKDTVIYNFSANNHKETERRFIITTSKKVIRSEETRIIIENENNLKVYLNEQNTLIIENNTKKEGSVWVYNIEGKLLLHEDLHPLSNNSYTNQWKIGVYIVKTIFKGSKDTNTHKVRIVSSRK